MNTTAHQRDNRTATRLACAWVLVLIGLLPAAAQPADVYDLIPRPSSISVDAKGRVLDVGDTPDIHEKTNPKIAAAEGWRISVDKRGITIEGSTPAGIFYGRQALRQILARQPQQLPYATIEAAPRFAYRGMHLDVCRHFFGKEVVKQYIDMMALHGMNTLHWHLSDDQGWRIEVKSWPRLTEAGSVRSQTVVGRNTGIYDETPHGGYYSQQDIREIVSYAKQRHINIIPEIDMPGHMLAALTAYPELGCTGGPYAVWPIWGVSDDILCAGRPEVYRFLEDVMTEVISLFPSEIIHMGGDEAPKVRWQHCTRCQQKIQELGITADSRLSAENQLQGYMVRYMERFLAQHGRRLMGWDEIADCGVDATAIVMNWRDWAGTTDPALKGFDVVRTPNSTLYFDHYQLPESSWSKPLLFGGYAPLSKVYGYEPAPDSLPADARRHVIGVQANLWTEYIAHRQLIEYQVLPRMAALAEVQWVAPERKDYASFLRRLPNMTNIYKAEHWRYCPVFE